MASDVFTIHVRLSPDEETMRVILMLLNLWQDANPDLMVAMVPEREKYAYEIIRKGANDEKRAEEPGRADG